MNIELRSDVLVRPIQHVGGDHTIVAAAKVSTSGEESLRFASPGSADECKGLINYLMKHRHGCYDDQTEVLTDYGWKRWPDVTGRENFATIDDDDSIVYQPALRLIAKEIEGPMVQIKMTHVDLLVTPDHNMLAKRRTNGGWKPYGLIPASDLLRASHRIRMGGGQWLGEEDAYSEAEMELLGFFIGDGSSQPDYRTPTFRLRRGRKISFLLDTAGRAGFSVTANGDRFYLKAGERFRELAEDCYDAAREKIIPRRVLELGARSLKAMFRGLMNSDGATRRDGGQTYSTTSLPLAGQIQEVALKIGRAAIVRDHPFDGDDGHFGGKPRYRVSIYRGRNIQPKVGWTREARINQVQAVPYRGKVYCVTVPNGTLYVRRNGIPCWCGNSPFEHSAMTFYVEAPIFVWREWMRHRVGWSYNEQSARYGELQPVFWAPPRSRPSYPVSGWKPGRPKFMTGDEKFGNAHSADVAHMDSVDSIRHAYMAAWSAYQSLISRDVALEVARTVLPVGIYSRAWVTCNPRSLMHFLSLRVHDPKAKFVSYPQLEIDLAAQTCEAMLEKHWPITHKAFVDNGRVAP